jgi:hypothetical protein
MSEQTAEHETTKTDEELRELRKQFRAGQAWDEWPDGVTNDDLAAAISLPEGKDAALEQELRELAFARDCELLIEHLEDGRWRPAFKQFGDPGAIAPRGVILLAAEAGDRRAALEGPPHAGPRKVMTGTSPPLSTRCQRT